MHGSREKIPLPNGHSFRVLRWSRNLSEVESLLGRGKSESVVGEGNHWHYHVEMELIVFTSGVGTRFVGDHIGPFQAGDVVLLGEKLPHYWHTQGPSAGILVQWSFPHGHPFWSFPEMFPLAAFFEKAGRGIHFSGPTAELITRSLQELARIDGPERLCLLLRILAIMSSSPKTDQSFLSAGSFSQLDEFTHQKAMGDAVRYLLANYREEIHLEDLLQLTGMSKPTFSREFKRHSGKTFSDFVTHVRLQAACRTLVDTDQSVLESALSCGFGQVSFFNRIFRRVFECSPSQFRERERRRVISERVAPEVLTLRRKGAKV